MTQSLMVVSLSESTLHIKKEENDKREPVKLSVIRTFPFLKSGWEGQEENPELRRRTRTKKG